MVFCYKISDPGNLGTIIRICDAVGVNRIVLSKDTVNQYNPKVVRATMGSVFNVPILSGSEIIDSIARMREKKIKIIMADTTAKKNYDVVSYSTPCALFVGVKQVVCQMIF